MSRFYVCFLLISTFAFGQNSDETIAVEVNSLRSNILLHSPDLAHLITGHPEGVLVSFSKKTYGKEEWQRAFNYPEYGLYILYQDFKNQYLGHDIAVGMHYNFYFLKRQLMFKISEGIAFNSNPYNKELNNKNKAFGSAITANTNIILEYKKENLIGNFGIQAGIAFTHFSNGRIKSPNSGINTIGVNLGMNYNFEKNKSFIKDSTDLKTNFKEPIKLNFMLRTGVCESIVINSGQHPFYHISVFGDKRFSRKGGYQFGAELFLTQSFKDFIRYYSNAYPEKNVSEDTDYKRVGVFAGYELFINRVSIETQIGYYVYKPFKYEINVYNRLGAKYYLTKNIYTGFSIKTHLALAEALEFNAGYRF